MPVASPASLSEAVAHHQRGELPQAVRMYQEILKHDPDNADALHLLGVAALQSGQAAQAVPLLERAVALAPNVAAFHNDLAEAYHVCGQTQRAAASYQISLRLQPQNAETAVSFGSLLMQCGRPAEAADVFRHALQHQPNHAVAHNNLGNALRTLGDVPQALACYRRAIELNPQLGYVYGNLGQLLVDTRQPQEALPFCQQAVRLQPQSAAAHNNLGNVYRDLGQYAQARACYTEALRLAPNAAVIHDNLGRVFLSEGHFPEAVHWLRQAVQLAPNIPMYLCQLGEALIGARVFDEAEKALRAALAAEPNNLDIQFQIGRLYHERGLFEEAQAAYRTILQLHPEHPIVNLKLGELLLEINQVDEALTCFRAARRGNPRYAPPLAQLAANLRARLPEDERKALAELIEDPAQSEPDRAALLYGLAQVAEAAGDYEQAAGHFERANAIELALRRKLGQGYHVDAHVRFVTRTTQIFTPHFFERTRGFGSDSERPVFIIGLPRSGTSLLEQILASHSRVFGAGEQFFSRLGFEALGGGSDGAAEQRALDALTTIDADTVRRLADAHLARLDTLNRSAERVIDKMPENYQYVGLLHLLFPRARFLHCRRDVRDVAVSCWTTHFSQVPWANDRDHLVSRFSQYRRIMRHWQRVLPDVILDVDYEDMVNDLEAVARRVVAFCGLDWEPACLEFYRTSRPVRTASVTQVRQPIYRRSVARWRNYEQSLRPLFTRLERAFQLEREEELVEASGGR